MVALRWAPAPEVHRETDAPHPPYYRAHVRHADENPVRLPCREPLRIRGAALCRRCGPSILLYVNVRTSFQTIA